MKLPSISNLYNSSKETFFRFPITCIATVLGTALALYLIEFDTKLNHLDEMQIGKMIMVLATGVPLLFGTKMLLERQQLEPIKKWGIQALSIAVIILHFFALPEYMDNEFASFYQLFVFGIIYSLFATFSPYLIKNEINGLWHYIKNLIIRLATTALYTGVLFIGVVVALLTIDFLLEVDVPERLYPQIWIISAGLIAPWFFLHGVPKDIAKLNKSKGYHKGVRIFSQYILAPLVATYVVILYLYSGKIIINSEWTEGLVSWLIIFFSITGVITNLILYPIRQEKEHLWAKWFLKGFYISVVPLLGMLFYSVWLRISPYGITENRYWVVFLGLWLLGISIYSIIAKKRNFKLILISLAAVGLIGNIGPWGAYSVSERSQVAQLEKYLNQAELLKNGKVQKATTQPDDKIASEIYSKVDYLVDNHGMQSIQHLFDQDLTKLNEITLSENPSDVITLIGLEPQYGKFERNQYLYFYVDQSQGAEVQKISQYDYLVPISARNENKTITIPNTKLRIEISEKISSIEIINEDSNQPVLSGSLEEFSQQLVPIHKEKFGSVDQETLTFTAENDQAALTILFTSFDFQNKTNPEVNSFNGTLLINIKNEIDLDTETDTKLVSPN